MAKQITHDMTSSTTSGDELINTVYLKFLKD